MSFFSETTDCPLCHHKAEWFCDYFRNTVEFFRCSHCNGIFKKSDYFPDFNAEKERYKTHNNDVTDVRYQNFVKPITNAIENDFSTDSKGLDYGCGTGPVASYVLEKKGFKIRLFDPFFFPDDNFKNQLYDFIICCEVMEHFFNPDKEFIQLKRLLTPNGKLYCKTKLIPDSFTVKEFKDWYYKDDPTHVFFYSPKTLSTICDLAAFNSVKFNDKLIIFNA